MSAIGKPHCAVYIILNCFKTEMFKTVKQALLGQFNGLQIIYK